MFCRLQAVDREKAAHVYNKRGEFYTDFSSLQDTEDKITAERNTESMCIYKGWYFYGEMCLE